MWNECGNIWSEKYAMFAVWRKIKREWSAKSWKRLAQGNLFWSQNRQILASLICERWLWWRRRITCMMWHEEHFWNVSTLLSVHLPNLVILSSRLHLSLLSGLLLSGLPNRNFCTHFHFPCVLQACPSYPLFYHPNNICWILQIIELFIVQL